MTQFILTPAQHRERASQLRQGGGSEELAQQHDNLAKMIELRNSKQARTMKNLWTDKTLWLRLALVASGAWFGGVVIVSQIGSSGFRWFPNSYRNDYDFGPAGVTAFVGIAVIFIVCLGIPWIADTANKKQDSN